MKAGEYRIKSLYATDDNGSVKLGVNVVAEIDKWDLSIDGDIYDTTAFTNAWRSVIPGIKKWSGSFSGRLYQGDTNGQAALQTALINGTSVSLSLFIDGTHNYAGTAYLKQEGVKAAVNSTVDKLRCPAFW